MSHQVVEVQPLSRDPEEGQWSTGLCECYNDVGDCKFTWFYFFLSLFVVCVVLIWFGLSLWCFKNVSFWEEHDGRTLISTTRGANMTNFLLFTWVEERNNLVCYVVMLGEWTCVYVCLGCFALFCLPVFTCKVTSAAGACPCLPLLDCIGCVPPASLAMRASVRQRYGIPVRPRIHVLRCHNSAISRDKNGKHTGQSMSSCLFPKTTTKDNTGNV